MEETLISKDRAVLTDEFFSIALASGHDPDKLRQGQTLKTYISLASICQAREMSQATLEEREKRSETFFDGIAYRQHLIQGKHDRGEAYGLSSYLLDTSGDCGGFKDYFPIYARVISIPQKIVGAGETWDITLSPTEFNMDGREEMYNVLNIGTLILEQDASIIVRGNLLILTCQKLIKKGHSASIYDIGILAGSAIISSDKDKAGNGEQGLGGIEGLPGVIPRLGANFLGKVLPHDFVMESLDGGNGADGRDGSTGKDGVNGTPCRIAEINIRSLRTNDPLRIAVIASDGGNGGNGGDGGEGGRGGSGVAPIKTFEGFTRAGVGGSGGKGGNGGNGGKGGHSGISSNVYVTVDPADIHAVYCFSKPGKPGSPGNGGLQGSGGARGMNGSNKASDPVEMRGRKCEDGLPGKMGRRRRPLPAASIFLNNELCTAVLEGKRNT